MRTGEKNRNMHRKLYGTHFPLKLALPLFTVIWSHICFATLVARDFAALLGLCVQTIDCKVQTELHIWAEIYSRH